MHHYAHKRKNKKKHNLARTQTNFEYVKIKKLGEKLMPATPTIGIANYCCIPCFFSFIHPSCPCVFIGFSDFGRVLCTTEGLM